MNNAWNSPIESARRLNAIDSIAGAGEAFNASVVGAQINNDLHTILVAIEMMDAGGSGTSPDQCSACGPYDYDYDQAINAAFLAVANIKAIADALGGKPQP